MAVAIGGQLAAPCDLRFFSLGTSFFYLLRHLGSLSPALRQALTTEQAGFEPTEIHLPLPPTYWD